MKHAFIQGAGLALAISLLAACGESASEGDTADAEAALPEFELLANGAPAYPGTDIAGTDVREPQNNSQRVEYLTDASIFEVADFYRAAMVDQGYEIRTLRISGSSDTSDAGGSVSTDRGSGTETPTRVSINPDMIDDGYEMGENYAEGFPAYPGAANLSERVTPRGNRNITFETSDTPGEVYEFYREAIQGQGEDVVVRAISMGLVYPGDRRTATISLNDANNGRQVRVNATTADPDQVGPVAGGE
ncbi:MAG: hypothetical protein AAGE05_08525 [Pseudomonadota bacterium]